MVGRSSQVVPMSRSLRPPWFRRASTGPAASFAARGYRVIAVSGQRGRPLPGVPAYRQPVSRLRRADGAGIAPGLTGPATGRRRSGGPTSRTPGLRLVTLFGPVASGTLWSLTIGALRS